MGEYPTRRRRGAGRCRRSPVTRGGTARRYGRIWMATGQLLEVFAFACDGSVSVVSGRHSVNWPGPGQPDEFATRGRCEKRLPEDLHRTVLFLVLSCRREAIAAAWQWWSDFSSLTTAFAQPLVGAGRRLFFSFRKRERSLKIGNSVRGWGLTPLSPPSSQPKWSGALRSLWTISPMSRLHSRSLGGAENSSMNRCWVMSAFGYPITESC